MDTKFLPVLALASLLFGAPGLAADQLSVTGCGISKKAYMQKAIKAYTAKVNATPRLSGGGAQKGIRLAAAGKVNMGASCRQRLVEDGDLHVAERDAKLIPVAWDALVAITHRDNPVTNLSTAQLAQIFNGEITNWSEVGGQDMPISVMTRKGSTSGVGYMARVMIFGSPTYQFAAKGKIFKSTGPLEKNAAATPGSIAFDGYSSAKIADVALIGIDGFIPSGETIASGDYPHFRPLYVAVQKDDTNPLTLGFVDFLLSDEGQQIIASGNTVSLRDGLALVDKWKARSVAFGETWQESAFN